MLFKWEDRLQEIFTEHCRAGQIIITAALDNLVKGASGQAVQNMNVRFGFAEDMGLARVGVFP